jgi:HD-like signal output (HDOD) protein
VESTDAVSILTRILTLLQRGQVQIPAVPTVVTELRELVSKSDSKLETIVTLLERDPALVARVLQLGRSAQFGRREQLPDLRYIINRVGFRQLSLVVESVWANDCFKVADARYQPYVAQLARLSVARAISMRALAEQRRGVEVFPAYLSGMFADVGASFLLWAIVDKSRGYTPDPLSALGFVREHHETFGSAVLKRWGHTDLVMGLVRHHHEADLTGPTALYSALLVLASQMSAELTGDVDPTYETPWPSQELLGRAHVVASLTIAARQELVAKLRDEYAEALSLSTPSSSSSALSAAGSEERAPSTRRRG